MSSLFLTIAAVMIACKLNVYSLERIMNEESVLPGGGAAEKRFFTVAITFLQYSFIVLVSLFDFRQTLLPTKLALRSRRLPLGLTGLCAVMFWFISCGGNFVLEYKVSIPVHATFRSSSLISNLLVGFAFFGRRYSVSQVLCAVSVTIGLTVLTLFRESEKSRVVPDLGCCDAPWIAAVGSDASATSEDDYSIGILLLLTTVLVSSVLGQLQDAIFSFVRKKDASLAGRPSPRTSEGEAVPLWHEMLLLIHLLGLPLFLPQVARIREELGLIPPSAYSYLAMNVVTQYVCISNVHKLAELTSPFTLTLTITLRKFSSLVVSIFMFGHYRTFSVMEWAALLLVVVSASCYPFLPGSKVVVVAADNKQQANVKQKMN